MPDFGAGRDKLVEPVHDRGGSFPFWLPASGGYCNGVYSSPGRRSVGFVAAFQPGLRGAGKLILALSKRQL